MASILGLITTQEFASDRFTNFRRSVFYKYPNGAAPLTGLLSLMSEESTNDPEFVWHEKRLNKQRTLTKTADATNGPYLSNANANQTVAGFTVAVSGFLRVAVVDNTFFRVGHLVKIDPAPGTAGSVKQIYGIVTAVSSQTGGAISGTALVIDIKLTSAATNILNGATANNVEVWVVGNSFAQGIVDSSTGIWNPPINIRNYTQIFRTPFSMSGTALKTSARYDETGPYKDRAKEASIQHMTELEKAFIFSQRLLDTTGATVQYNTGGLLYWIQQWELGSIANGGLVDYRPGETAAVLDSDDNKRIIDNTPGTITEKQYDAYLERIFRSSNNTANEKLVLCGSGWLSTINQLYKSKAVLNVNIPSENAYGMTVVEHRSPFGVLYYKTHPLFSDNPNMRFNALVVDVQNLRYRYVDGRDTELLIKRQPNDADYRKDEWLTECGLEVRFPETHMYLKNFQAYA